MEYPSLSHHGATRGVTGSCHQLHLGPSASVLIDCGLEQGSEAAPGAQGAALGFDIQGIQALVITHVHLSTTLVAFLHCWLLAIAAPSCAVSPLRGCCPLCWKMPTS